MVPHYLNTILTDLRSEDLVSIVLTADEISEISQYDFDTEKMTVHPKHATLPNNENKIKDIAGLESIKNPFKVNIYPIIDIREIGYAASGQAIPKARK